MSIQYIEEFDLLIDQVALAHRGDMAQGSSYGGYKTGRLVFGLVGAVQGKSRYRFSDGGSCSLKGGEIALIPAESLYIVQNNDPEHFIHYTINFSLSGSSESLKSLLNTGRFSTLEPDNFEAYRYRFEQLISVWGLKRPGYALQCRSILYDLLHRFLTELCKVSVNDDARGKILPAVLFIESHYGESITVELLARLCSLSPTHFRRLFHEVYNISSIRYLLSVRIQKAKDLLLIGYHTVAEIAALTGFQDASYFCRYFRSAVGVTPHQFKCGLATGGLREVPPV